MRLANYDFSMQAHQEPEFITPPELAGVLSELIDREPIFHRPEHGTARADFERMTAPGFWETGASGERYSRAFVLEVLEKRWSRPDGDAHRGEMPHDDVWDAGEFCCRELAPEVYLLTYTLLQRPNNGGARKTRRATIWQRTGEGWKIVYHQGTVAE
jgi:hypothetical protein